MSTCPRKDISVCMAAFNGERYIAEQLNSILSQLSPHDELVIVDDASRDSTREIIRGLHDDRIMLREHISNRGVVASFEEAIQAASGEIIFLSDQDDVWLPDKICEFLAAFECHPDSMVVVSDAVLVNECGEIIAVSNFRERRFRPGVIANLLHSRFVGSLMAFRSTLVPAILPFPRRGEILHDIWIGTLNTMSGGATWYIDKPLVLYRRHGSNLSRSMSRSRQIRFRVDLFRSLMKAYLHQNWTKRGL